MAKKKKQAKKIGNISKLKKIFKKTKQKIIVFYRNFCIKTTFVKKYLVFYFSFLRLRVLNLFRYRISFFINKWHFLLGTAIYFIFLSFFSFKISNYINTQLLISDAITFFTSAGAMIGGILAIIFSLNILLMDKAEKIPTGFYDIAAKDKIHNFVYILISASSLILFVFAVTYGTLNRGLSNDSLTIALFIIGLVFYLVFVLYQRVLNKLNPNYVLFEIRTLALNELKRIKKRAEEIAYVLRKDPNVDGAITNQTILAKSYQYLKPDLFKINLSLNYLFDYHDRLISNRERSSAESVLQIIETILVKYFETRQESSIVLPSGFLLSTVSDSNEFLTPVFERLLAVGEEYMKNDNNTGITKVVRLFRNLSIVASKIHYVTGGSTENPILGQCRGYFDQLMESAIKLKSLEGLFQGAISYKDLGIIAVQKSLFYEMTPVFNTLEKVSIAGLFNKQEAVLSECIKSFNGILIELIFSSNSHLEVKIDSLLEHIETIIYLAFISVSNGGLSGNYLTQTSLALPFQTLKDCIYELARKVEENEVQQEINKNKNSFIIVVEKTRSILRSLSGKMKNADHLLINTFGEIIADIGVLLLDLTTNPKWSSEKRELETQIGWYIHQPEWFTQEVPKIKDNQSFDSLIEAVTKIGIKAIQVDNIEIAIESEKIIKKFAIEMLEKEEGNKFGFTEPRIMERACFVGILALKLGKNNVVDVLKQLIQEFETAYVSKWFPDDIEYSSPRKNQLSIELVELIDELNQYSRPSRILNDSREQILELVTVSDIKEFIFTVWSIRI
jgi:hypothetical protein